MYTLIYVKKIEYTQQCVQLIAENITLVLRDNYQSLIKISFRLLRKRHTNANGSSLQ